MSEPDYGADYLAFDDAIALLDADPLAYFQTSSDVQEQFLRGLSVADEIYLHSGQGFGKTIIGAAVGVALARGKPSLAGIELPVLRTPNTGLVLSLDYEQQKLSVQAHYLRMVGRWPHEPRWEGEVLKSLRVKPDHARSDNPKDWSLIQFMSQKNLSAGIGARAQWVHGDEPPLPAIWKEIRKAGLGLTIFPHFITATPLKRSQWWWLRADYPLEHAGRVHNGFLRLRGSTRDNRALLPHDLARLERQWANLTPDERATRFDGHEYDSEGSSPFRRHYAELQRWLEACVDGEMQEWAVGREVVTREGKRIVAETVEVEVWEDFDPLCVYRVTADCSLGIDDGEHDPGEACVWNMTRRTQAARYNGYLGEYGLAVLSAKLARRYGEALVDPDVTGGYGSAFLSGLREAGYQRVYVNRAEIPAGGLKPSDIGFTIGRETRREFCAAINEALLWSQEGRPFVTIRSREQVAEMMDLVLKDERPVTAAGRHDESLSTFGRICTLLSPEKQVYEVRQAQSRKGPREVGREAVLRAMGLDPAQRGGRVPAGARMVPGRRLPGRR